MTIYDAIKILAPEDVRPRTYVVVVSERHEACMYSCDYGDNVVVLPYVLQNDEPVPLHVELVALPLVLVSRPDGSTAMLDVRRHRVARVDARFGRRAAKRLAPKDKKKPKKRKSRRAKKGR